MGSGIWNRKRVLVTGCTGLLGSWMTEWLVGNGADVVGLIRDRVPQSNFFRMGLPDHVAVVRGAIEDYNLIERILNEYEIEVIFHLAAQTIVSIANENPRSTFSTNIAGTWNILEAARRCGWVEAVVLSSSDKAYGEQGELPYKESTQLHGNHPYDVSKSCADLIGQAYWKSYQLPIAITRCGNLFGGGDFNFNRIVPGTIRSIIDEQRPIIRSDGTLRRDYIFIKDIVMANGLLAEKLLCGKMCGEAFNFSNEHPVTVLEIVNKICSLMGRKDLTPVIQDNASNEIPHQYLSATKAQEKLEWSPKYGLEAGLKETIAWYSDYFHDVDKGTKSGRPIPGIGTAKTSGP